MKKALIAAALLISSQAQAGIIYDTMKGAVYVDVSGLGFCRYMVGNCGPFRIETPGRINTVETLLSLSWGVQPLSFGIADSELNFLWEAHLCSTVTAGYDCQGDCHLVPDQMFSADLNLTLRPEHYFLLAQVRDPVLGDWHLSSIESNAWMYWDHVQTTGSKYLSQTPTGRSHCLPPGYSSPPMQYQSRVRSD